MNRFSKTMLLLVFMGLFFIFYNMQLKPKTTIALCQASALTDISIQQTGSPMLRVSKSEDAWQIVDATQKWAGEADAIDAYRRFVCYMPFVEFFDFPDESVESLQQKYGISEKNSIAVTGGSLSEKLYVGKLTPSGTEFYLYTSKQPKRIYTAPNSYVDNLFPEIADLLSRFPFFALDNITTLQIEFQGREWQLLRDENGYRFSDANVSSDLAQAFVGNLYGTFFTNYKSELSSNELIVYSPEFYDLKMTYTDPVSGQKQQWLLFKMNDSYNLLQSFGGVPNILILDSLKMDTLEKILFQMLSSEKT